MFPTLVERFSSRIYCFGLSDPTRSSGIQTFILQIQHTELADSLFISHSEMKCFVKGSCPVVSRDSC